MSDDGGLIVLGLIGAFFLGAVAASKGSAPTPAPRQLPPPKKNLPIRDCLPINTPRRVMERKELFYEDGHVYDAYVYEPPYSPAPWTVHAWYDEAREWHVINITPHPNCADVPLGAEVRLGVVHKADRSEFRRNASVLYPDDKFENRVVYRSKHDVVFLIDIECDGLRLDFFHESKAGKMVLSLVDGHDVEDAIVYEQTSPVDHIAKHFESTMNDLTKLEQHFHREREKITNNPNLSDNMKATLEGHLRVMYEDFVSKAMEKVA